MQDFNKENHLIHIETLGCRLNQIESESIAKYFNDKHFIVSFVPITSTTEENKNVCLTIVNTCTVTQKAEQKARRIIRLILKKYINSLVIVTGCYAQLKKKEIEDIDSRIIVFGGQIKSRICDVPDIISEINYSNINSIKERIKQIAEMKATVEGISENSFKLATTNFVNHSRASLKIQDGCNNNCSYCAIHMARGKSVSLSCNIVLERVVELEKKGYEEVVITTVNIAQYKSEYNGEVVTFAKLLDLMLQNTQTINFRISSLYPEIVDDYFCTVIQNKRVRPHFHISVQSGSDKILQLMNRRYKSEDLYKACEKLSKSKKDAFLACDIITGFPGETEDDFNLSYDLCKKVNFAWMHIFPFSERDGTTAVMLKNKVPQEISRIRAEKLTELAIENKINYLNNYLNKELYAILETVRNQKLGTTNIYHAVTDNFIHCEIDNIKNVTHNSGEKIKIKIIKVLEDRIKSGDEMEVKAIIL